MKCQKIIRLSLLGSLLVMLNSCGSGSSNINQEEESQEETVAVTQGVIPSANENESTQTDTEAPVITIKGDSQVDIIQGSSFKDVGATAVDADGNPLEVTASGIINTAELGSYTIVYRAVDGNGNEAILTRIVQVIAPPVATVSGGGSYVASTPVKSYYLVPVNLTPTNKIGKAVDGIDFVSGQALFKNTEASSPTSKLQINKIYRSYDDRNKLLGTFTTEYDSRIDKKLPENIKSANYTTAKESCEQGWGDIDSKSFLGTLEGTKAIYNQTNTLCDIYSDDNQVVASLVTKHVVTGISNHLHTLTEPDGTVHIFYKINGKWVNNTKAPLDFEETATGYKVSKINGKDEFVTYDTEGKLTTVVIKGQTITLDYDADGKLTTLTDQYNKKIKLFYNADNLVETIQAPDETNTSYEYNADKQLIKSITADGTPMNFTYNAQGDLESVINVLGLVVKSYGYDSDGKAISTAELGGKNSISIEYLKGATKVTKATGERLYSYKVINSLLKTTSIKTSEGTSRIEYDSHGYTKKIVDHRGVITKTTYDEIGLLKSKTTNAETTDEKTVLKRACLLTPKK